MQLRLQGEEGGGGRDVALEARDTHWRLLHVSHGAKDGPAPACEGDVTSRVCVMSRVCV